MLLSMIERLIISCFIKTSIWRILFGGFLDVSGEIGEHNLGWIALSQSGITIYPNQWRPICCGGEAFI